MVFARLMWPTHGWVVPVAAAASILPAWGSYELLEQPIRQNLKFAGRRALRLTATCVALPVLCWALVWGLISPTLATARVADVRTQWRLHSGPKPLCLTRVASPAAAHKCGDVGPTSNELGAFALVGDSNAQQFIEPATSAAKSTGIDLLIGWKQGCPFAEVEAISETSSPLSLMICKRFVRNTIAKLKELRPKVVVLAAASSEYILLDRITLRRDGVEARTPDAKAEMWERGLAAVARELSHAGIPAIVVHPVPNFAHFDGNKCPAVRIFLGATTCGESLTRAQVVDQQALPFRAERDAIRGLAGVSALDFTNDLCTASKCSTNVAKRWRYRDGAHLSVPGSLRLSDRFAREVLAVRG